MPAVTLHHGEEAIRRIEREAEAHPVITVGSHVHLPSEKSALCHSKKCTGRFSSLPHSARAVIWKSGSSQVLYSMWQSSLA
ncbi:MAG: hypothetical protein ACYS67_08055 [Planctomycetota bacterium]